MSIISFRPTTPNELFQSAKNDVPTTDAPTDTKFDEKKDKDESQISKRESSNLQDASIDDQDLNNLSSSSIKQEK